MNMEIDTNNSTYNRILIEGVDVSPFSGFGQWGGQDNADGFQAVLTSVGLDTSSATFPRLPAACCRTTACSRSVFAS